LLPGKQPVNTVILRDVLLNLEANWTFIIVDVVAKTLCPKEEMILGLMDLFEAGACIVRCLLVTLMLGTRIVTRTA
jgi:hypothetical protein